jgi:hypothetical protein
LKLIQLILKHAAVKGSSLFYTSIKAKNFISGYSESKFKGSSNFNEVIELANASKGTDEEGYEGEFLKMVKTTSLLSSTVKKN